MVPPIRQFPPAPARVISLALGLSLVLSVSVNHLSFGADDGKSSSPPEPTKAKTETEIVTDTDVDTKTPPQAKPAAKSKPEQKQKQKTPPAATSTPVPASELFPVGSVERPLIVRTFLPNLIANSRLFPNHRPSAAATGYDPDSGRDTDTIIEPVVGLPAAIAVNFGDTLSIAWDTVECRWLYAWRGGFLNINDSDPLPELIGDIVYLAQGNAPLSTSIGADARQVKFYGYREVDGVPEFLYTIGILKVAERIQPGDDGKTIVQHFNVERNQFDLMLTAPSAIGNTNDKVEENNDKKISAHSISVTNGKLKGDFAMIPKKNATDFALVHTIGAALDRPDTSKDRTPTKPLLTQNSKPAIRATPVVLPSVEPEPDPTTTLEPEPDSKTMLVTDAAAAPSAKPDTSPAPDPATESAAMTEADGSIIVRAHRYDRDILLTDPHVEAGAMKKDSTAFSDRDFKFTKLPDELIGADYVRTFDRDKYIPGDILSYRLQLGSDAYVYVLIDKRLDPMPKWVDQRFKDTGKLAALDAGRDFRDFRVLRTDADAGEFRFGPQDSGASAHFYIIAATPRQKSVSETQKTEGSGKKSENKKQKAESKK